MVTHRLQVVVIQSLPPVAVGQRRRAGRLRDAGERMLTQAVNRRTGDPCHRPEPDVVVGWGEALGEFPIQQEPKRQGIRRVQDATDARQEAAVRWRIWPCWLPRLVRAQDPRVRPRLPPAMPDDGARSRARRLH